MNKKELEKTERENAKSKEFKAASNVERGKAPVTNPANVVKSTATATVEKRLTVQAEKSATVRFLKEEHLFDYYETVKNERYNFKSAKTFFYKKVI